ncbi:MAG: Nudix family hydrolase [Methylococcaceae bacterium]|nr:Nudix family hydrolase [Methylococcaceae bacterium]
MKRIQVAVGVVADSSGKILIARRLESAHQGGMWEFPGGKIKPGEPVLTALRRELGEELGIEAGRAWPLIRIRHRYPDLSVVLHVFRVEDFSGQALGREGQETRWVDARDLCRFAFPEANLPIISAIRLPAIWPILNEDSADAGRLARRFREWVAHGVTNLQIRCKQASAAHFANAVRPLCEMAASRGIQVVLNGEPGIVERVGGAGVHLSSRFLWQLSTRPLTTDYWVGASCHNLKDLLHAQQIGLDYAFLSPVQATSSHPDLEPLEWERFASWVDRIKIPVYALGGLTPSDLGLARSHGAQGIAGISAFAQ